MYVRLCPAHVRVPVAVGVCAVVLQVVPTRPVLSCFLSRARLRLAFPSFPRHPSLSPRHSTPHQVSVSSKLTGSARRQSTRGGASKTKSNGAALRSPAAEKASLKKARSSPRLSSGSYGSGGGGGGGGGDSIEEELRLPPLPSPMVS